MAKGIAIILTFALLAAALVIIGTYSQTSMSSTAQGVNLSTTPQEIQSAYNASQNTAIAATAVSHWTIYMVGIFAVIVSLVVLILMVQANRKRAGG